MSLLCLLHVSTISHSCADVGDGAESCRHYGEPHVAWSSKDQIRSIFNIFRSLEGSLYQYAKSFVESQFLGLQDKVPLSEKLDQILQWIDLPLNARPQLIMGNYTVAWTSQRIYSCLYAAYEPSLDQAGHATGPYSKRVNVKASLFFSYELPSDCFRLSQATLLEVDGFAKNLHDALADRHLTDIVDIVFVSDHGMTDTSHPELVYMDDILGDDGLKDIAHEDGWPSMGLRFKDETNVTKHLGNLLRASDAHPEKFSVFTHDSMPERYHFANNDRIAPIYVVPKIGYVLTTKAEGDVGMTKGVS